MTYYPFHHFQSRRETVTIVKYGLSLAAIVRSTDRIRFRKRQDVMGKVLSTFAILFFRSYGCIRSNSTLLDAIGNSRSSILLPHLWGESSRRQVCLAQPPIARLHRRPPPQVPGILSLSVRNGLVGVEQRSRSDDLGVSPSPPTQKIIGKLLNG